MTIDAFLASIRHRVDALEQINGAIWGERIDPRLPEAERQKLVVAKLELERRQ